MFTNNKYVISRNKPLQGYELISTDAGINVYKNDNVLPIGFATNNIMNKDDFKVLNIATQMEALLNVIVTDDKSSNDFIPSVKEIELNYDEVFNNQKIIKEKDNTYSLKISEPLKITYELPEEYHNKILIIRFKMNHEQSCSDGDQIIRINNIKNKLTCKSWKYHNGNYNFDFVLAEQDLTKLTISFQEGEYNIGSFETYALEYDDISNISNKIDALVIDKDKTKGDTIIGNINVKNDGYFMLTIPYDKGFTINVDNQKIDYELVDDAFIGFKISKGKHNIKIEYTAPLKNISLIISCIGIISFCIISFIESKRTK